MKDNKEGIRINKYISDYGFCSRREADALIENERVTINNRLATPGDRVVEGDKVRIDGENLAYTPQEARPKKHRWGPPRNAESEKDEATTGPRTGKRGTARNASTTRGAAKPAAKSNAKPKSRTSGTNTKSKTSTKR